MKRSARTTLLLLAALPILFVVSCSVALPSYDEQSRRTVLRTVAAELPPHASMTQMEQFMERHAAGRYSYDPFNLRWEGLLPQSNFDRAFFDRKVGVDLKVDRRTGTFRGAEAQVYYTFL